MKNRYWVTCMLLGAVLFTACGQEAAKDERTAPTSPEQQEESARVVELTLSFIEPRFRPDPIEIKVGEPVQFKVSSADTRHRFVVEPFGINVEVPQKSLNESVTTKVITPT